MELHLRNQTFILSPNRGIYWREQKALILSDMHIGKGGHFRKAGIPIPGAVQDEDLRRLDQLVAEFKPDSMIVVGDMFHSYANNELEKFEDWRKQNADLKIILVKGNHDILSKDFYVRTGIELVKDGYTVDGIMFSHHPPNPDSSRKFTFSGHLHPGVNIKGVGRQRLRLPAYWLSDHFVVLPAFSHFTGLYIITPDPRERIIAIAEDQLIEL